MLAVDSTFLVIQLQGFLDDHRVDMWSKACTSLVRSQLCSLPSVSSIPLPPLSCLSLLMAHTIWMSREEFTWTLAQTALSSSAPGEDVTLHVTGSTLPSQRLVTETMHVADTAEIRFSAVRWQLDFESAVTAQNDKFKGSFQLVFTFVKRQNLAKKTRYLASILSDTFVKCNCRNMNCALGKWSLHSRWNFVSTFTELHVHGDERWLMKWRQIRISAVSTWQARIVIAHDEWNRDVRTTASFNESRAVCRYPYSFW